jgi:N-dimethylarginine dimethylaminohydrolase
MTLPTPRILMCRPDYYGIEYEINPWMNRQRQADRTLALAQWQALVDLLGGLGAQIELVPPVAGLPDLVFTANAGLIFHQRAILSHFRPRQRQGEEEVFAAWFAEHGFQVVRPPSEHFFEGAGDALFCGATLFAGYRIRSDIRSAQWLAQELGCEVIPLELVNPYYYHLDTCFCPLAPDAAIWYPPAFDAYGQRVITEFVPRLIAVADDEARAFACNAVVIGWHVVTNTGCPRLHEELARWGYTPHQTPLGEFVKAGGSAKCLTLRLDGEDAAAWRQTSQEGADGQL